MSEPPAVHDAFGNDARRVLEERARALAEVPALPTGEAGVEVMRFRIGQSRYAVELGYVLGVFRPMHTTRLADAAAPVIALTVWRGDLLIVVDVADARRDMAVTDIAHVIVLGRDTPVIGLAADAVEDIAPVALSDVHVLPESLSDTPLIRGVTDDGASLVDAAALMRTFAGSAM